MKKQFIVTIDTDTNECSIQPFMVKSENADMKMAGATDVFEAFAKLQKDPREQFLEYLKLYGLKVTEDEDSKPLSFAEIAWLNRARKSIDENDGCLEKAFASVEEMEKYIRLDRKEKKEIEEIHHSSSASSTFNPLKTW